MFLCIIILMGLFGYASLRHIRRSDRDLGNQSFHNHSTSQNNSSHSISTESNHRLLSGNVKFVAWPHARVFDGYLESGVWIAGDTDAMKEHLNQDFDSLDSIQEYALRDGIFFPSRADFPKFHIFSSAEAVSCFQGKKIFLSGDSYMVQMYIALSEILLGEPSNEDIKNGKYRDEVFVSAESSLKKHLDIDTHVKFLYYHCHLSDYTCMNGEMIDDEIWKSADAFIPSVYIHYKGLHINDPLMIDNYGKETAYFFKNKEEKKLTWVPGVSFRKPFNSSVVLLNLKAIEEAKKQEVPLLDVFTMTEMCAATNCSTDGGHKSRYVNRMKVQMLLNNLCSYEG
jgi:hypothetical protein